MRGLWDVIGTHSHVVDRRAMSLEDRGLTTIMIYQGAALAKNSAEAARRSRLADQFEAMGDRYWDRPDAGEQGPEQTMRAWVIRAVERERPWYEDLTWRLVQSEHQTAIDASTHGARRAEPAALPDIADIRAAASQEVTDAVAILDGAIAEGARP